MVAGALDTNGIELDYPAADSEWQPLTKKCYLCGEVFKSDALGLHIRKSLQSQFVPGVALVLGGSQRGAWAFLFIEIESHPHATEAAGTWLRAGRHHNPWHKFCHP